MSKVAQAFRPAVRGRPERLHYLLVVLLSVPLLAHHSATAKYDAGQALTLAGTVSSFSWRNPHCFLYIDVDAGLYKGRRYVVEMSSAGVLRGAGWSGARIKAGDRVEVTVMPSRTAGAAAGLCRECSIRINGKVTKA